MTGVRDAQLCAVHNRVKYTFQGKLIIMSFLGHMTLPYPALTTTTLTISTPILPYLYNYTYTYRGSYRSTRPDPIRSDPTRPYRALAYPSEGHGRALPYPVLHFPT